MKNETVSPEIVHPHCVVVALRNDIARERTARLITIIGALYRLSIAAGVGALVWRGGSGWLLVAAVPLMFFAPKARR